MVLRITNFKEQEEAIKKLNQMATENVGVIVVDSIAMLYRYEIGKSENSAGISEINRSLGLQLSMLIEIARSKNIPSVLTNHVYADFDNPENVKLVGGDILKYSCKCLIELKKLKQGRRLAIIRKHRSIPENKEIMFRIVNSGIEAVKMSDDAALSVELTCTL
jgi:DNA repair protein RadB